MGLFAIKKHFLPWSFVGLFLAATGCDDKEVGEGTSATKRWVESLPPETKDDSSTLDSDKSPRALSSQKQAKLKTVPFDCTQEDRVKKGECWGQCEVDSKNPNKCKPREIKSPCKGQQPDDCLKQNKGGNTQCFLDFRGKAPQSSNPNPENENAAVYYAPKCVHLSPEPKSHTCRMKPPKEIDDECKKH
ncbi:MAG: hypothetical protein AAF320_03395, partial [Myxococcota bacterium]